MVPIDELYLEWLYTKVPQDVPRWELMRYLHQREFVWLASNDDNRMSDGLELREEFLSECRNAYLPHGWAELGCSMLEMLVALAKRADFQGSPSASDWFKIMLTNAELWKYEDGYVEQNQVEIDEILDRIIYRYYSPSGHGGFFPLRRTTLDQRKVELWYQLAAYLLENNLLD